MQLGFGGDSAILQPTEGHPRWQSLDILLCNGLCQWTNSCAFKEGEWHSSWRPRASSQFSFANCLVCLFCQVTELIGVDVKSTVNSCLIKAWQRAIEEQGRFYKDAVEHRESVGLFFGSHYLIPSFLLSTEFFCNFGTEGKLATIG